MDPSNAPEPEPAATPGTNPEPSNAPDPTAEPSAEPAPAAEPSAEPEPMLEPYLPLREGVSWTYDVTQDGLVTRKETTVGALEPVGGTGPNATVMAFRVTTTKDGDDETVSWQARMGDLAIRYREQAFNAAGLELEEHWAPFKLRLDESARGLNAGGMWQEVYDETKLEVGLPVVTATRTDTWTVMSASESITVPAGTFDCLRVRKVSSSSTKEYWFARGVGKVKETGGQTEELASYEIP
jgi:hypothetical protein